MGDFTRHQMWVIRSASLKTMKNWKRSKRRAADCSISFEGIIIIGANILQKRTHQSHSPHSGQSDTLQKTLHVGQLGSFGASLRSFRGQAGQNSAFYSVATVYFDKSIITGLSSLASCTYQKWHFEINLRNLISGRLSTLSTGSARPLDKNRCVGCINAKRKLIWRWWRWSPI